MALVGQDFRAPLREIRRVQFGVLSPDEIVSIFFMFYSLLAFQSSKVVLRSWILIAIIFYVSI